LEIFEEIFVVLQARHQCIKLSFLQLTVFLDYLLTKPEKHAFVRFGHCNSIITLIQLCAFVGLNLNNGSVIHGMDNVKHFVFYIKVRAV